MSASDSFLFVSALVGSLSLLFALLGVIADYLWPWMAERQPRRQATYLQSKP